MFEYTKNNLAEGGARPTVVRLFFYFWWGDPCTQIKIQAKRKRKKKKSQHLPPNFLS